MVVLLERHSMVILMNADDLLLLYASVSGLQCMLDIVYGFGQRHLMIFDSKK